MWDLGIDFEGYCRAANAPPVVEQVSGCSGYSLANNIRLEWLYTTIISFGLLIFFLKRSCDYRLIDIQHVKNLAAFMASPLFVVVLIESYPQTWQIALAFLPATWAIISFVTLGFLISVKFEIVYLIIIREVVLRIPFSVHLLIISIIFTLSLFDIKSTELLFFLLDILKEIKIFFKIDESEGLGKIFFMPLINEIKDYAHIYEAPHANYSDVKYFLVWLVSFFGVFIGGWLNYFGIAAWMVNFLLSGVRSVLDRFWEIVYVFIPFLSVVLILFFLFPINGQARNVCVFWIFFVNVLKIVFPHGYHMHALILVNVLSGFYFL